MDAVAATLAIFQQNRQLAEIDKTLLIIVITGNGAQIDHLRILSERHLNTINIGKLITFRVHRIEIGVAFQHPLLTRDGLHHAPSGKRGQITVQAPIGFIAKKLNPGGEARCTRLRIERFRRRIFGQKLLEVMQRRINAIGAPIGLLAGLTAAHQRISGQKVGEKVIGSLEDENNCSLIHFFYAARFAISRHFRRRSRHKIGVLVQILEPENPIIGRMRRTIGPAHPFAQENCSTFTVRADLIALAKAGDDLRAGPVKE